MSLKYNPSLSVDSTHAFPPDRSTAVAVVAVHCGLLGSCPFIQPFVILTPFTTIPKQTNRLAAAHRTVPREYMPSIGAIKTPLLLSYPYPELNNVVLNMSICPCVGVRSSISLLRKEILGTSGISV